MSALPIDLVLEILSYLPVESVLRFRCLSKRYCRLIDSPTFVNLHKDHSIKTRSNISLIFDNLINDDKEPKEEYPHEIQLQHNLSLKVIKAISGLHKSFNVLASCNGLILLFHSSMGMILWNPATKQHRKLPKFWRNWGWEFFENNNGFGYDVISDDYKVMVMRSRSNREETEAIIHSLKKNSTRKIQNCCFEFGYQKHSVEVGGFVHWVARKWSTEAQSFVADKIVGFDLVHEKYGAVPIPEEWEKNLFKMELGVLDGCLSLGGKYAVNDNFEIWIMKEYGVNNSWSKLCFILKEEFECIIPRFSHFSIKPLCYSKMGDKILLEHCGFSRDEEMYNVGFRIHLFWYDLQLKKLEILNNIPAEIQENVFCTHVCVRTCVSLRDQPNHV